MTRAEMMARMTAREWREWLAWMRLYPTGIGERGAYVRAGTMTAWLASAWRDTKAHSEPFGPADVFPFLADLEPSEPEPTPEEFAASLRAMMAAAGRTVIDTRAEAG